jgi:hypothetical protein
LNELAQSGVVAVLQEDGKKYRERMFRLNREPWQFFMPRSGELNWFAQAPFYVGCRHLLRTLNALEKTIDGSERLMALKIRETLVSTAVSFERAGWGDLFAVEARFRGEHLVEAYESAVEGVIRCLRNPRECVARFSESTRARRRAGTW